jgi:hypothetical protein
VILQSARPLRWAAVLAVALVGCSSPTEVRLRFDLSDGWEGTFRGSTRTFEMRLDLVAGDGVALGGSATVGEARYDADGRYEPPTVWVKLTSPTETLEFVGEMLTSNLINGSVLASGGDMAEVGRLTLVRR